MRAIAILGPNATRNDLISFQRADLGVALTQEQSPQADVDAVLIFGGDGTIHRHLAKLVETRIPLLAVPGGSGNDFARALGLKSRAHAVAAWEAFCAGRGRVRQIDVGVITPLEFLPGGTASTEMPVISGEAGSAPLPIASTYFCCIGGAGLDSETNRRVNGWPAFVRAHGGYVLAALREVATWKPLQISVKVRRPSGHWEERISEPATFVVFANSDTYGDGMQMAPQAQLDDGLLDVCFVRRTSKIRILRFFPTVFSGKHLRLPEVEYFRAAAVRVETERPIDVYADGDYVCKTPVEVTVVPRALSVIGAFQDRA